MKKMQYIRSCLHHGQILTPLNTSVQEPKATSICGSRACSAEKSKSAGRHGVSYPEPTQLDTEASGHKLRRYTAPLGMEPFSGVLFCLQKVSK